MNSTSMADVIRKELAKGSYQMPCDSLPYETQAANIAAMLAAAGFGHIGAAIDDAAEQEDS